MKRIISLALTMVLLVACLAVPVMADETDDLGWIQLLDYGTDGNSGSNYIRRNGREIFYVAYNVPSGYFLYSYDLLIKTDSSDFSLSSAAGAMSIYNLGDGLYRVFGDHNASDTYAFFSISSSNGSYFEILSFRASLVPISKYSLSYYGYVYDYSYSPIKETYFSGDGSSPMSAVTISPNAGQQDYSGYVSRIYLSSWNAYDYISLNIALFSSSFASLKVELDSLSVPYEINTIESTDVLGTSLYLLDVLIDVRNLNRNSTSSILVDVSGMVNPSFTGNFTIRSCLGLVSVPDPSPWTYWFINLKGWLSSGFSSVTTSLSALGTNIGDYIIAQTSSIIDAQNAQHEADRLLWNTISSNVGTWISDQTTAISNSLSTIDSSIANFRTNVGTWLSEQTTAITTWGNSIVYVINDWSKHIKASIDSGADRIVAALSPNGSADDFTDKVQQQGSTLEDMAGAMGAVTRPDVSTAIPDISGYLTVTGPVTLASVFAPFWDNSYILRLLLASLAVSVAFTVVYGGKK